MNSNIITRKTVIQATIPYGSDVWILNRKSIAKLETWKENLYKKKIKKQRTPIDNGEEERRKNGGTVSQVHGQRE